MTQRLRQVLENLLKIDPNQVLDQILARPEFRDFILDLVRQRQLFEKGEDGLGRKLRSEFAIGGKVYATFTEILKEAKNQPTDRVTLKDTGAFYRSFRLKITRTFFEIDADTRKADGDLADTWGEAILGLQDESLQMLIDRIRNEMAPIIIKEALAA